MEPQILFDLHKEPSDRFTVENCVMNTFPMSWFTHDEGCLGHINNILPEYVQPFTAHEQVQCLGVLLAKCFAQGSIKSMWKRDDSGLCPSMRLGERFGIPRDRFLVWMKYLTFAPFKDDLTDADKVKPLLDEWNAARLKCFAPGKGIILDESISKFKPFFDNTPKGIKWLVKIARKPVGIGAEIKNAACAETSIMLRLELQEGKVAMSTKEHADR